MWLIFLSAPTLVIDLQLLDKKDYKSGKVEDLGSFA